MTGINLLQIGFFIFTLVVLAKLLGKYMTCVYEGRGCGLNYILSPLEKAIYYICRIDPAKEMDWKAYTVALLIFNFFGFILFFIILHAQNLFPLNPQHLGGVSSDLSFNAAISFITNTDWVPYSSETTISYFGHMFALTVQNFLSAATGMAVLIALIRGISRREGKTLGNFWVDLTRSIVYILLPLATILALILVSQGVVQNLHDYQKTQILQPFEYSPSIADLNINQPEQEKITVAEQILPMGPAASQISIKQLGTNGGDFFSTNAAHPFENPTPVSNFLEVLALILIPAAFCFTFGSMIRDKKQGLAIFLIMTFIFIPFLFLEIHFEHNVNPVLKNLNIDYSLGNMEGKETRFGYLNSALWTTTTTASSNGAANSSLDSYMPLGGLVPMWLMQLGEVVYGGVGSGVFTLILFIIMTVFIAGLMVGRTPEYLGKKIEVHEVKMASLAILVPHFLILLGTAVAVISIGRFSMFNPGAHGFSEILYAFTSTANNNGSIFAGFNGNIVFYNILTGIVMLVGRFGIIVPVLAIAGSLVNKKIIPITKGTLATHNPLFISLSICVILIFGALAFFPVLSLGPIIEHLVMLGK